MKPELKTVLLVEDNADIRTIAKTALELMGGLQVRACESGPEALAAVADLKPQLVILDVMMPDMDGPGVLSELRKRPETREVPVIFLTAKAGTAEVQRLLTLGALEVLTKPFDPMTLHQKVKAAWDKT